MDLTSIAKDRKNISTYQPKGKELENKKVTERDYDIGWKIMNTPFREFDNKTLLQVTREEHDQFNMVTRAEPTDVYQKWRSRDIKPMARKQMIELAAELTANSLVPMIFAMNTDSRRDRDAEDIMKSLFKWNIQHSDYDEHMLSSVFAFVLNRACYMSVEFMRVMQDVRVKVAEGKYEVKEVVDEILSGLQLSVIPVDEVFITNAYEPDIQRQRAVIRRRIVSYQEADGLYSKSKNWKFITPGVRAMYHDGDGLIYDVVSKDLHSDQVEVIIHRNRREDKQVEYVNGIEMWSGPIKHRSLPDENGITRPKYPIAKGFFAPSANPRFYYGMSAVAEVMPQAKVVNKMHQLFLDGTYLATQPPTVQSGGTQLTAQVFAPGVNTYSVDETRIERLGPNTDPMFAYNAAKDEENSLKAMHSINVVSAAAEQAGTTAYAVAALREQALKQLGIMGKQLTGFIEQVGELVLDIIVHHETVGTMLNTMGDDVALKYPTFLLEDEDEDGRTMNKIIVFSDELIGVEMTDEERNQADQELLNDVDEDTVLVKVNPVRFSEFKYSVQVTPDMLVPKTEATRRLEAENSYNKLIQSPYANKYKVSRDFLFEPAAPGDADAYMIEENEVPQGPKGGSPAGPAPEMPSPLDVEGAEAPDLAGLLQ